MELAWRALKERRVRSALTILMVMIAVTLIVSVQGLNAGFGAFIDEQLETLGANVLVVSKSPILRHGARILGTGMEVDERVVNTVKAIPEVRDVVPYVNRVASVTSKGLMREVVMIGTDLTKLRLVYPALKVKDGAIPHVGDVNSVVLGHGVANPPGGQPFAKVGDMVMIELVTIGQVGGHPTIVKRPFQVKAVLEPVSLVVDDAIFITMKAADTLFKVSDKYDGLYVITKGPEFNEKVEADIKRAYGDALYVTSPKAVAQVVHSIRQGFANLFISVAAVSMVVASVGIVASLYTSVLERTKEIGLLKAIGFTDGNVCKLFLLEAIMIGIIGGTLGIASGILFANAISDLVRIGPEAISAPPLFTAQDLILTWISAAVISALAGLYPAYRASKLDPVVALRRE